MSEVQTRLRALLNRDRMEREMDEELHDHLARDESRLIAEGHAPSEARRLARARFGAADAAREGMRDERGTRWLEDIWRDVRHAGRSLARRPLYTATACITLGLGIAAASAVYALVSMLLLRPLDVDHPEQLVALGQTSRLLGSPSPGLSYPTIRDIAAERDVFAGVTAYSSDEMGLRVDTQSSTVRLFVHQVMGNYFTLLGLQPAAGRLFTEESERLGEPVFVLSYSTWERRFAKDAGVVGRSVSLNGSAFTIIGVAPRGWLGLMPLVDAEGYVPLEVASGLPGSSRERLTRRGADFLRPVARLQPGKNLDDARAILRALADRIAPERGEKVGDYAFLAEYEHRSRPVIVIAQVVPAIASTFLALAVLALLIACVNVGNLVLSRTMARSAELALRRAIGASRARVMRELLVESCLLGMGALLVALPVAWVVVSWFANLTLASDIPIRIDTRLDLSVLTFCAGAALIAGLVTGLAPALRGSAYLPGPALREASTRATATSLSRRWDRVLLAGQLALSLVLVIAGGLFTRSLQEVTNLDIGLDAQGVVMASVDLSLNQYTPADAQRYFARADEVIAGIPGVTSFGHLRDAPMGYNKAYTMVQHIDKRMIGGVQSLTVETNAMSPMTPQALGMRLIEGRGFTIADDSTAPRSALVNEVFAARMWPELTSVTGQRFLAASGEPIVVVGVVHHLTSEFPTETPVPQYFLPTAQVGGLRRTYYLRTSEAVDPVLLALRRSLQAIDPAVGISEVRTLHSFLREGKAFFLYRIASAMTLAIGALGVLQTLVGLYGVIAYGVSRRAREFGIRAALGASRTQLIRQVMGPSITEVGAGSLAGIVVAALLLPAVGTVLSVSPRDPVVYTVCAASLFALALLAVYLPSRRAACTPPAEVLRSD